MNLPELQNPGKYVGLYVIDFGDHAGVGFTASEVAELLESEKFSDIKVYKIHNAHPDGRMALRGIRRDIFQLETGMFFHSTDFDTAQQETNRLVELGENTAPPGRAKIHLTKYGDSEFAAALIYPAEYDDEFSRWLLEADFSTAGPACGGIEAVQNYYSRPGEILRRHQLFGESAYKNKTGDELLAAVKTAVQR